jgi:hypothetical protein
MISHTCYCHWKLVHHILSSFFFFFSALQTNNNKKNWKGICWNTLARHVGRSAAYVEHRPFDVKFLIFFLFLLLLRRKISLTVWKLNVSSGNNLGRITKKMVRNR